MPMLVTMFQGKGFQAVEAHPYQNGTKGCVVNVRNMVGDELSIHLNAVADAIKLGALIERSARELAGKIEVERQEYFRQAAVLTGDAVAADGKAGVE